MMMWVTACLHHTSCCVSFAKHCPTQHQRLCDKVWGSLLLSKSHSLKVAAVNSTRFRLKAAAGRGVAGIRDNVDPEENFPLGTVGLRSNGV